MLSKKDDIMLKKNSNYNELVTNLTDYKSYLLTIENLLDEKFWQKALYTNTKESYETYIKKFPCGIHKTEAKQKLYEINKKVRDEQKIINNQENQTDIDSTFKTSRAKEICIVLLWGILGFIFTLSSAKIFVDSNISFFSENRNWFQTASGLIFGSSNMIVLGLILYIKRVKLFLLGDPFYYDIKLLYHLFFIMFNFFFFVNFFCAVNLRFYVFGFYVFDDLTFANILTILLWVYPILSNKRFKYWIEKTLNLLSNINTS